MYRVWTLPYGSELWTTHSPLFASLLEAERHARGLDRVWTASRAVAVLPAGHSPGRYMEHAEIRALHVGDAVGDVSVLSEEED